MRRFQIYRYDPDNGVAPHMQSYDLEVGGADRMLLDVLVKLKAIDPSLSFRRSCREGICGSDAININGKNGLACVTNMRSLPGTVVLKPLPGLPVIRDLFVDMTGFFKQYHSIRPWLDQRRPAARARNDCSRPMPVTSSTACTSASCAHAAPAPARVSGGIPNKCVGPAGLLQAYRFLVGRTATRPAPYGSTTWRIRIACFAAGRS